jgi:hypothetical protein
MVPQDSKGIVKPTLCLSLCAKWVVEQHRVTKKENQKQISHAKLNHKMIFFDMINKTRVWVFNACGKIQAPKCFKTFATFQKI